MTLEELLRRASAAVERGPARLIGGSFRPTKKGRPLTRIEKGLMILMAAGLSLAVWLHARPIPVNAHTVHYQSLAATTSLEAAAPLTFAESALQALGRDWRVETFFTCVSPVFWRQAPAIHPNARTARIEQALARLAAHGPLMAIMTFPDPTSVESATVDGKEALASQVAGQLELADGTVVRFSARLLQDDSSKRWGLVDLVIPGFLQ
jgi:hypothetical protein